MPCCCCCCCLQDSGSFLCVIDDSNEHMLSVWDCTRGTKQAEVKVRVKAAFGMTPWDHTQVRRCHPRKKKTKTKPHRVDVLVLQSTNEAVFAVEFNPNDSTNIITCGKSHIYFWTLSSGQFTKKQGIFGVRRPLNIFCCSSFRTETRAVHFQCTGL